MKPSEERERPLPHFATAGNEESASDTESEPTLKGDFSDPEYVEMQKQRTNRDGRERENYWRRDTSEEKRNSVVDKAGGVDQIKDLLTRLSPMIAMAGNSDTTAEILMFLSDTDPNFHTLQLVKSMRKDARDQLEETVKQLVENHVDRSAHGRYDSPVISILNSLFQEKTFTKFMENFQGKLMSSVDYLHQNYNKEVPPIMLEYFMETSSVAETSRTSTPSNHSSLNSSLNQSGFLFLTPMQYDTIATSFLSGQNSDSWLEYLNQLLAVTPGEPVIQQCWNDLKRGLKNCLHVSLLNYEYVNNSEIFDRALRVHAKLVSSQTQIACTESNINLMDTALDFWNSKKFIPIIPRKSAVISLKRSIPVLKIVNLLIHCQKDLPSVWIRFPENLSETLVEKWLNFVSIGSERKEQLSSLDLVSILDSDASWLRQWMHGRYGRSKVIKNLDQNAYLLKHSLNTCVNYMNNANKYENTNPIVPNSGEFLTFEKLEKLKFIHSFSVILEILKYQEGRDIFPVTLDQDEDITMDSHNFLNLVYRFIEADRYSLSLHIRKKLKLLCTGCESIIDLICRSGLPQLYIKNLMKDRHKLGRKSILVQVETLNALVESEGNGLRHILLGEKQNEAASLIPSVECDSLLKLLSRLLLEEHESSKIHEVAFTMCVTLLKYPFGRHLYEGHSAFSQTFIDMTHLYELRLLGILEFVCEDCIKIEHRQSLLRETAAIALNGGKGENDTALSASIIATIISCEAGITAVSSVLEEDNSVIWREEEDHTVSLSLPILAVTTSYRGVEVLSEFCLRHLAGLIFSDLRFADRQTGLLLLAAATSNLDSRLLLQHRLGYKEELMRQQYDEDTSEEVMIDECFLLRNHIISRSLHLGTEHPVAPLVPPHRNLQVEQYKDSGTSAPRYGVGGPKQRIQSGLWQFMQGEKVHDQNWLSHCKRHFQAAVVAGDAIKTQHVITIIDTALDIQRPRDDMEEHLVQSCEFPPYDHQTTEELPLDQDIMNYALDLAQKMSLQLELLSSPSRWSHHCVSSLLEGSLNKTGRTDWFIVILYIFCDGNAERAIRSLGTMRFSSVGPLLWPALGSARRVVRITKLFLSLHEVNTYNALQHYTSGGIWNLLTGWLDCCWLGVLGWSEVANWLLLTSLHGPESVIYFTVTLLRHKLRTFCREINSLPTAEDRLLAFQCDESHNWRLGEHLPDIVEMRRKYKRIMPTLLRGRGSGTASGGAMGEN